MKFQQILTNFVAFVREVVYNFKGIFSNTKGGRVKCPYSVSIDFTQMRKIERQMNFAISNRGNWSSSNTQVSYNENTNCSSVYLHGHQIATFDHNLKAVKLSSCGWQTNTTKSRLNAILDEVKWGCKVFQKNFEWFVSYNGQTKDFFDGMILVDANHLEVA